MDWKEILTYILSAAIVALISYLSERLIVLINQKIQNQKASKALSEAVELVVNAVKATQQEYVDELKKAGTFDTDAQKIALEMAIKKVRANMSAETEKYLTANADNLNDWIADMIHSVIYDMKK